MKVSIDFDGTLTEKRVFDKVLNWKKKYPEIKWYIITSRLKVTSNLYLNHPDIILIADWLDIPYVNIKFTNLQFKLNTIKELGISAHLDNNPEELLDDNLIYYFDNLSSDSVQTEHLTHFENVLSKLIHNI